MSQSLVRCLASLLGLFFFSSSDLSSSVDDQLCGLLVSCRSEIFRGTDFHSCESLAVREVFVL